MNTAVSTVVSSCGLSLHNFVLTIAIFTKVGPFAYANYSSDDLQVSWRMKSMGKYRPTLAEPMRVMLDRVHLTCPWVGNPVLSVYLLYNQMWKICYMAHFFVHQVNFVGYNYWWMKNGLLSPVSRILQQIWYSCVHYRKHHSPHLFSLK